MQCIFLAYYNKIAKVNNLVISDSMNIEMARIDLVTQIIYGERTVHNWSNIEMNKRTSEVLSNYKIDSILIDTEELKSNLVNPSIVGLYNPTTDTNYLIIYESTRYVSSADKFIELLLSTTKDEKLTLDLTLMLRNKYHNKMDLNCIFKILKELGCVLTRTTSLKNIKIKN